MDKRELKLLINEEEVRKFINEYLTKKTDGEYKKIIINKYIEEKLNLTKEEFVDKSPNSILTIAKAHIGREIAKFLKEKYINLNEDRKIILNFSILDSLEEKRTIKDLIIKILSENNNYLKKEEIFRKAENKLLNENKDKYIKIKNSFIKNKDSFLKEMLDKEILIEKNKYISLPKIEEYPNTEIGKLLKKANNSKSKKIKKYFIEAINLNGGEAFERYCLNLLEKYLKQKYTIKIEHTGGTADDGIIKIKHYFFDNEEVIGIQTKQRKNKTIPVKDVREFLGALVHKKFNRGIFITNSKFHKEASRFIKSESKIIGINEDKLYEIAKESGYGILEKNGYLILDKEVFII